MKLKLVIVMMFVISNFSSAMIVGGWYPVFFDSYSEPKVTQIIDSIKAKKVKKIVISFDENKKLALQIKRTIQSQANIAVELSHLIRAKDDMAKYDHKKVVVTIWNN